MWNVLESPKMVILSYPFNTLEAIFLHDSVMSALLLGNMVFFVCGSPQNL